MFRSRKLVTAVPKKVKMSLDRRLQSIYSISNIRNEIILRQCPIPNTFVRDMSR